MFLRLLFAIVLSLITDLSISQIITVMDENGSPVPDAAIVIKEVDGSGSFFTTTDPDGQARMSEVGYPSVMVISHISFEDHVDTLYATSSYKKPVKLNGKNQDLEQVIITTEIKPRHQTEVIPSTLVISQSEIREQAAVSLDDVLEKQAGIRTSRDNILGTGMTMNGMSGENIKYLVDGVPIIGRLDGNIDLQQILLSNVERVELINGPMSAMYGTDAAGGVVNIITDDVVTGSDLNASTYYETAGHYNMDGSVGLRKDRSSLRLGGGRYFFKGWSAADSGRSDEWKPKEQVFGNATFRYAGNRYSAGASFSLFDEEVQNRGETRVTPYYAYAFDEYYRTRRISSRVFGKYLISPHSQVNSSVAYSLYERNKTTMRRDMVTLEDEYVPDPSVHDTTNMNSWNIRSTYGYQHPNKKVSFQTGIDFNTEVADGSRFTEKAVSIADYAVFGTAEFQLDSIFTLQPSVRMAYNTNFKAPVVPSIAALINVQKNLQVRLSYGRGFRAPGIKELYLYFVDINHNVQGNEDLLPEYSDNFYGSVALNNELGKVRLRSEAGVFHNSIRNMITLAQPDPSGTLFTYVNIGKFRTHGINIRSEIAAGKIRAGAGFSYTGRYNLYSDSADFDTYLYNPDLSLNAGYEFVDAGLSVNAYYRLNGAIPAYRVNEDEEVEQFTNESYSIMDVVIRQSVLNGKIILGTGIKNLFDVKQITSASASGAHNGDSGTVPVGTGRSFFFNLNFSLNSR